MTGWLVVVPIRMFTAAKTRLRVPDREQVARAVALDTLQALEAAPIVRRVLVVTDDTGGPWWPRSVAVVQQRRRGLNEAIAEGVLAVRRVDPAAPVAVVLGDLPRITPMAVTAALAAAARVPVGFIRDAAGTGTTGLTVAPGVRFSPAFGPGSAALHRALGAMELTTDPALRQDLDTPADLAAARRVAGRRLSGLLASDAGGRVDHGSSRTRS